MLHIKLGTKAAGRELFLIIPFSIFIMIFFIFSISLCAEGEKGDRPHAEYLLSKGQKYGQNNQYNVALHFFTEAIRVDPTFARAYRMRGLAYFELDLLDEAIADLNRSILLDPQDAYSFFGRGSAYLQKEKYANAIDDFNKALKMDSFFFPNFPLIYVHRGNAFMGKRMFNKALEDYNRAIEIDPNNSLAFTNRGFAHQNIGNSSRAISDLIKAAKLGSKEAQKYLDENGIKWKR